ncbi:hypothetical protein E1264_17865 [Actinomadura sp. KC216]|uniref:hypothetical protein n=1 Tax=Actinomadura sp. KC216 TaxID=2530370 RepID=UPI001047FC7B|nr:hypothetical protein [Actinomadura sp. KC216]TDB86465.1 hypothetical protein E1264_17865 [Actinomadura sp. KC216]
MADYRRRERHFIRTEYVLDSGTPWGEVKKAFAGIEVDLGEDARWDDAARVEARDDEIVIWHEREVTRDG